jgi:hypothetical protein
MWHFPLNAIAPCSWTPEESQVESSEHQDNATIHCQPFPESVSEEHEIYNDYDGCHRHHLKHDSYLSAHFRLNRDFLFGFPNPTPSIRDFRIWTQPLCKGVLNVRT